MGFIKKLDGEISTLANIFARNVRIREMTTLYPLEHWSLWTPEKVYFYMRLNDIPKAEARSLRDGGMLGVAGLSGGDLSAWKDKLDLMQHGDVRFYLEHRFQIKDPDIQSNIMMVIQNLP